MLVVVCIFMLKFLFIYLLVFLNNVFVYWENLLYVGRVVNIICKVIYVNFLFYLKWFKGVN